MVLKVNAHNFHVQVVMLMLFLSLYHHALFIESNGRFIGDSKSYLSSLPWVTWCETILMDFLALFL